MQGQHEPEAGCHLLSHGAWDRDSGYWRGRVGGDIRFGDCSSACSLGLDPGFTNFLLPFHFGHGIVLKVKVHDIIIATS